MITVTYDADIGNVWTEFSIEYYIEKGYKESWEGRYIYVPTQIYINSVTCLCVEGEGYYKQRQDLRGWEKDLDTLCRDVVDACLHDESPLIDFLLECA